MCIHLVYPIKQNNTRKYITTHYCYNIHGPVQNTPAGNNKPLGHTIKDTRSADRKKRNQKIAVVVKNTRIGKQPKPSRPAESTYLQNFDINFFKEPINISPAEKWILSVAEELENADAKKRTASEREYAEILREAKLNLCENIKQHSTDMAAELALITDEKQQLNEKLWAEFINKCYSSR